MLFEILITFFNFKVVHEQARQNPDDAPRWQDDELVEGEENEVVNDNNENEPVVVEQAVQAVEAVPGGGLGFVIGGGLAAG